MLPYQNPKLDIEQRLDDLISRMTLEELILQTDQYASTSVDPSPRGDATRVIPLEKMEEVFRGMSAGSVGAWDTTPAQTNQIQRYAGAYPPGYPCDVCGGGASRRFLPRLHNFSPADGHCRQL